MSPCFERRMLLLVLAAASLSCAAAQPNDPNVMAALLAQRDAIDNWAEFKQANNITGWTSDIPYCEWDKKTIQCNPKTGALILDLGCIERDGKQQGFCALKAKGTLAPQLANITQLIRLFLNGQSLSGTLPDAWGASGAFPSLLELWVTENQLLTGTLPASWGAAGRFSKLKYLYIGYNAFSGPLPDSWGSPNAFPALNELQASHNQLSGTLPVSWGTAGAFPSLQTLNLNINNWTGTLPESWGGKDKFPAMQSLTIMQTPITGALPDSWAGPGAFPNLVDLELATNQMNGTLPASWGSSSAFQKLEILYLDATSMTGPLPDSWAGTGAFPVLSQLGLSHCNLTGTLPASWGSQTAFQQLGLLDLESNLLTGPLPESWGSAGSWPALGDLDVSNNDLNGTLPANWGSKDSFRLLESLNLETNRLSGTIPATWGSAAAFPNLQKFSVASTSICGTLPAGLANKVGDTAPPCLPLEPVGPAPGPQAAPVPAPAPAPAPGPVSSPSNTSSNGSQEDSSGSSTNVGAIVGGVVGGLAAVAILAFFALRPGKGFLRRGSPAAKPAGPGSEAAMLDSIVEQGSGKDFEKGLVGSSSAEGTLVKAGTPVPSHSAFGVPLTPAASSRTASRHSGTTDPVLSYIASSLATVRPYQRSVTSGSDFSAVSALPQDMSQWLVEWDEIRLEHPIGKGSFGWVYYAYWKQTPVAAKVLINTEAIETGSNAGLELPQPVMSQLLQEARVMTKMRHPNIVNFVGICPLPPCILTEYCTKGSLYSVLRGAAGDPIRASELTWSLRMNMLVDAARGIVYLHSMKPPIIHRDIKSPNLLVDKANTIKVSDFNLSKLLLPATGSTNSSEGVNNPTWQAPEVLQGAKESAASDVYSFGMVMLEMLTWELPWSGTGNYFQVAKSVVAGIRPDVPALDALPGPHKPSPEHYGAYCTLMRECWSQEPEARPPISEVAVRLASMAGAD